MTVDKVGGQMKEKLQQWNTHILLVLKLTQSTYMQSLSIWLRNASGS